MTASNITTPIQNKIELSDLKLNFFSDAINRWTFIHLNNVTGIGDEHAIDYFQGQKENRNDLYSNHLIFGWMLNCNSFDERDEDVNKMDSVNFMEDHNSALKYRKLNLFCRSS